MAIAFAQVSPQSRSRGHSAIAGIAYRTASKLFDNRTGQTHDYSNRKDVAYSAVMLPDGADDKYQDRELLWNTVEACEKRKDAQVAKDVVLALPRGLAIGHHVTLARNFADANFVSKGLVADIAIHDNETDNPHAHIYITTRRLLGSEFSPYKARDLNPTFAKGFVKDMDANWGQDWANFQNTYFRQHGMDMRVDPNHIIPQKHEGKIFGKAHYLKAENALIRKANREIALTEPESVLNILGSRQSVFSERDMERILFKSIDDVQEYQQALIKLKAHPELVSLGLGDDGRERFTTRSNFEREARLATQASRLFKQQGFRIDPRIIKATIANFSLGGEQANAIHYLASGRNIDAVIGLPGAGKTHTIKAAVAMWEQSGFRVRGMAVAGVAARQLEKEAGIRTHTISGAKWLIANQRYHLTDKDVVVMDEAGMTDVHDMGEVINAVSRAKAKLVLVGDHDQLLPVGSGTILKALVERIGYTQLSEIRRQRAVDDQFASRAVATGDVRTALLHYQNKTYSGEKSTALQWFDTADSAIENTVSDWGRKTTYETLGDNLIVTHRRIDVQALNLAARDVLVKKGIVAHEGISIANEYGNITLAKGDKLLFLENNAQLGVNNGTFARVLNVNKHDLTVIPFQGNGKPIKISLKDYQQFDYGYATTVHKAQGGTFKHVFGYLGGKAWNRHITNVLLTRHKESVHLYADKISHKNIDELISHCGRHVIQDNVLDFPLQYGIRRGFNEEKLLGRCLNRITESGKKVRDSWLFVTNYAAYYQKKRHEEQLAVKQAQRDKAKTVAHYIDINQQLGKAWSEIVDINDDTLKEREAYQLQPLLRKRNELAATLVKDLDDYQYALKLNRVKQQTLLKAAEQHTKDAEVAHWFNEKRQGNHATLQVLSVKINQDIKSYYGAIRWHAKQNDVSHQHAIKEIQTFAKEDNKEKLFIPAWLRSNQNEWDALRKADKNKYPHIYQLTSLRESALKKADQVNVDRAIVAINRTCNRIVRRKEMLDFLDNTSPHIAKAIHETTGHEKDKKAQHIDWFDNNIKTEWDKLTAIGDNQTIRSLSTLYARLSKQDKPDTLSSDYQAFTRMLARIAKNKRTMDKIRSVSPLLARNIQTFSDELRARHIRSRGKDGIDL